MPTILLNTRTTLCSGKGSCAQQARQPIARVGPLEQQCRHGCVAANHDGSEMGHPCAQQEGKLTHWVEEATGPQVV